MSGNLVFVSYANDLPLARKTSTPYASSAAATATVAKARALITEMSYGRRLKELAELEAALGISDA